jgi:hypothetical protein
VASLDEAASRSTAFAKAPDEPDHKVRRGYQIVMAGLARAIYRSITLAEMARTNRAITANSGIS